MKHRFYVIFSIITILASCKSTPADVPSGTWKYNLMVNGINAGTAQFTNTKTENIYTIKSEMYLKVGAIENSSIQVVKETLDFKPISLEVVNTVSENGAKTQEFKKLAIFNGKEVNLTSDNYSTKFTIEEPFVLDGNFFFNELIKHKFKKGTVIKAKVYEPTVELEDPILVIIEVIGYEDVNINGKTKNLLHIKQKVEKLKSLDVYLNENGVTEKVVIKMLNNLFELVRID